MEDLNIRTHLKNSSRRAITAGERGQSLLELMLAIGISALLIGAVALTIALALRVDTQNKPVQGALFMAQSLTDKVASLAEADWRGNIDALNPSPAQYYVAASGGAFSVIPGSELVTIDEVEYTRYFTVEPVYRDSSGVIADSGTLDPSTKKVTGIARWTAGAGTTRFTVVKYVTRSKNISSAQTDWSGGAGQSGTFSSSDKYDTADVGIDTAVPGTIKLRLQ